MPLKKVLVSERGSIFIYITYVEVQRLLFLSTSVLRSRVGFQSVLLCTLYFYVDVYPKRAAALSSNGGPADLTRMAASRRSSNSRRMRQRDFFPHSSLISSSSSADLLSSQTPPLPPFLPFVYRHSASGGKRPKTRRTSKRGGNSREANLKSFASPGSPARLLVSSAEAPPVPEAEAETEARWEWGCPPPFSCFSLYPCQTVGQGTGRKLGEKGERK